MDWKEHTENFNRLAIEAGYTIAQYAAEYGLNANTARRYLRSSKDGGAKKSALKVKTHPKIDYPQVKKAARRKVSDHESDQNSDHLDHDHDHNQNDNNQVVTAKSKGAVTQKGASNKKNTPKASDHDVISASRRSMKARLEGDRMDRGRDFEINASDFFIDNKEIGREAREMLRRTGADALEIALIEKTLTHLLMLEEARNACLDLIDQIKTEGDDTPVQYRVANMLANTSNQIVALVSTLHGTRNAYRKELREQEKHAFAMGSAGIIKLAYQKRREHGWDNHQTADYIVENGGKVPPYLMECIKIELKRPVDTKEDSTEQTASNVPKLEDLDRMARDRAAQRKLDAANWVASRRQEVTGIVDSEGYGDVGADGAQNDSFLSLDLDDDDEEIDEDAMREIYGPNGEL